MTPTPEVTYVLPDKLGGVFNFAANLLEHRRDDGMGYAAVLTDNAINVDTRSRDTLRADRVERVAFSLPPDNLYTVLRRLSVAIRPGPGVLVSNDWIELACATAYDTGRAVIAVAHGDFDFYYELAVKNEPIIDAWIVISERIREQLTAVIPHRSGDIFLIPFGVPIPSSVRTATAGRLRAIYSGRLSRDKGIFDLPAIDRALRDQKVDLAWTIQGTGPDEEELRARWQDRADVEWKGYQPMDRVLAQYLVQDVLVMPSRSEGLPVALLEAGAAGVVPVVSNLLSGIPDVVQPAVTGFRPEVGDIAGFAESIARLDGDRSLLESLSRAVRAHVEGRFNAVTRTAEYQRLFGRWHELRRSRHQSHVLPYGSRLDQPWIPNPVVRAIRSTLKKP